MNALNVFTYTDQQVRTVLIDGEPWFVAADVCKALGLGNGRDAVGRLDEDGVGNADIIDSMGRTQSARVINESGLYELIFQSRVPGAKAFKRWVTHEVLPTIRRTGQYGGVAELPRSFADALELAAKQQRAIEAAEAQRILDAPKVESFDAFMDADGQFTMEAAAKSLTDVTGGMGRNKLMAWLRDNRILMSTNTPYQQYAHWFKVVAGSYTDRYGNEHATKTTYVRPEGLDALRKRFSTTTEN